jgi:hypothetical protein
VRASWDVALLGRQPLYHPLSHRVAELREDTPGGASRIPLALTGAREDGPSIALPRLGGLRQH